MENVGGSSIQYSVSRFKMGRVFSEPSVIPETAVLNIPIKDCPPEGDTTTNEEVTEEDEAEVVLLNLPQFVTLILTHSHILQEGRKDSEEALHPEWLDEIRFMR